MTHSSASGSAPPDAPVPDAALLVRVGHGDQVAARHLLERLGPRVLRHVARMLGNQEDAEEVLQETFLRLWRIAPDWRQGEAKVSTWVFGVAINLTRDRLRTRRPSVSLDAIPDPVSPLADAVAKMTEDDRRSALDLALAQLPERQRQAVSLRHIEEMSNPEIAEIMDISVEAVESLTSRGKRALVAALKGKKDALGYDDDT